MSLTRKMLKELGLTEEQITAVIEGHSESINALTEERNNYKAEAEKVPALERQLEEAKETAADEGYKQKYEDLKKEYREYKDTQKKAATAAQKKDAYKALLSEVGVSEKRIDKILKVTDLGSVELDEDGKIKDSDKHKKTISEEWADFIVKEGKEGADTSTPPGNAGKYKTKDEIMSIKDTGERQQAIAENHELFGF